MPQNLLARLARLAKCIGVRSRLETNRIRPYQIELGPVFRGENKPHESRFLGMRHALTGCGDIRQAAAATAEKKIRLTPIIIPGGEATRGRSFLRRRQERSLASLGVGCRTGRRDKPAATKTTVIVIPRPAAQANYCQSV
jgi:hypothetical protein